MSIFEKAAQSVLSGDRIRSEEFGGQKLTDVVRIDADEESAVLTLHMKDGSTRTAMVGLFAEKINRPDKREIAPADVHDAVRLAIFSTVSNSTSTLNPT